MLPIFSKVIDIRVPKRLMGAPKAAALVISLPGLYYNSETAAHPANNIERVPGGPHLHTVNSH